MPLKITQNTLQGVYRSCLSPVIVGEKCYPCGKCARCMQRKRNANTFMLEQMLKDPAICSILFITLTYDNYNLPVVLREELGTYTTSYPWQQRDGIDVNESNYVPVLNRKHVQLYLKSIRGDKNHKGTLSYFGFETKYFLCGEYGGKKFRPHYHLLLALYGDYKKYKEHSNEIESLLHSKWVTPHRYVFDKKGNKTDVGTHIEHVNSNSKASRYVSKYVNKFVLDSRTRGASLYYPPFTSHSLDMNNFFVESHRPLILDAVKESLRTKEPFQLPFVNDKGKTFYVPSYVRQACITSVDKQPYHHQKLLIWSQNQKIKTGKLPSVKMIANKIYHKGKENYPSYMLVGDRVARCSRYIFREEHTKTYDLANLKRSSLRDITYNYNLVRSAINDHTQLVGYYDGHNLFFSDTIAYDEYDKQVQSFSTRYYRGLPEELKDYRLEHNYFLVTKEQVNKELNAPLSTEERISGLRVELANLYNYLDSDIDHNFCPQEVQSKILDYSKQLNDLSPKSDKEFLCSFAQYKLNSITYDVPFIEAETDSLF